MVLELAWVLQLSEADKRLLVEARFGTASILPFANLPEQNPYFTGRKAVLSALHTALTAGDPIAVSQSQAINGLGGIGKTQLALAYAYRYRAHYHDLLWALAESRETLVASYVTFAEHLRLNLRPAQEPQHVVEAVILRNAFYVAFAPEDARGTINYGDQRYRGQHEAAFTVEEWEKIRAGSGLNLQAPHRAERASHSYEFSGYSAGVCCGLPLRCAGRGGGGKSLYYRDAAKLRQLPCLANGNRWVRIDLVREQFGQVLESFTLPANWREEVQRDVVEGLEKSGLDSAGLKDQRERLQSKRKRVLKLYKDGFISAKEMQTDVAVIDLALSRATIPPTKLSSLMRSCKQVSDCRRLRFCGRWLHQRRDER